MSWSATSKISIPLVTSRHVPVGILLFQPNGSGKDSTHGEPHKHCLQQYGKLHYSKRLNAKVVKKKLAKKFDLAVSTIETILKGR